ncbi:MAG: SxtJ family membrane protein [Minwuia sp.]|nr:SxtJ family membrane protein [Minwuia sp.]
MSETHGNVEIKGSSDRSFGLVFTAVFVIVALLPLLGDGQIRIWALIVAALILAISFIRPTLLAPLNLVWFKFGMLLGKIMTPIVMGLLYFVTITPIGLIMRAVGKDPLRTKLEPEAETYWQKRDTESHPLSSMRDQY